MLSTLEADGSRRWLKPKLSRGKLLTRRRIMAYVLIAIFTLLPFVKIAGKPLVLLDIVTRRFTIFGFTFLPTDTVLLVIFLVGVLLGIVLFTTLFGRVWCGWACPQTVYMEFVFRPIERLFEGTSGRGGDKKKIAAWRIMAKYVVYFLVCLHLANTFLAYFVGVDRMNQWVARSPLEHPGPFLVVAFVTFAMMVDFCFFREQMCLIACPYGRLQSVLLDQHSLVVAYDAKRGDPRGKVNQRAGTELPVPGDCVDCGNCVTTCPTGIDIRDGLQMECINCTQCIDACNTVMKKVGRQPDLIRFSSQAVDQGAASTLLRARTLIYPLLLLGVTIAFFSVLLLGKPFDAVLLRNVGNPHTMTDSGQIRNLMKIKLTNRTEESLTLELLPGGAEGIFIENQSRGLALRPRETRTFDVSFVAPYDAFSWGRADLIVTVKDQNGIERTLDSKLIGPYSRPVPKP